jgi:hypothetical protein
MLKETVQEKGRQVTCCGNIQNNDTGSRKSTWSVRPTNTISEEQWSGSYITQCDRAERFAPLLKTQSFQTRFFILVIEWHCSTSAKHLKYHSAKKTTYRTLVFLNIHILKNPNKMYGYVIYYLPLKYNKKAIQIFTFTKGEYLFGCILSWWHRIYDMLIQ